MISWNVSTQIRIFPQIYFAYCNAGIFINIQHKVKFLCSYTKYTELLLDFHTVRHWILCIRSISSKAAFKPSYCL